MPHIRKVCHPVMIDLMIQVFDILPDLIPHLLERACQRTDLIVPVISQVHIIIRIQKAPGGGCKLLQRICNGSKKEKDQYDGNEDGGHSDQGNDPDQPDPWGIDLG